MLLRSDKMSIAEYEFHSHTIARVTRWCESQVGKNFNPEAADFNLEGVFSLGLHNLAEFIGDLSSNANKELGIEQVPGLRVVHWRVIELDSASRGCRQFGHTGSSPVLDSCCSLDRACTW